MRVHINRLYFLHMFVCIFWFVTKQDQQIFCIKIGETGEKEQF